MDSNFKIVSITDYVSEQTTIQAKITALNNVIDKLELSMLDVADSAAYKDYWMKDGQMEVRATYNSIDDVVKQIEKLTKLKVYYQNKLTGRISILRSGNL